MQTFDIGDTVRVTGTFTAGTPPAPSDPTTVTCTARKQDGTSVSPAVVRDAIGTYHADLAIDQSGDWWYRFVGAGNTPLAAEARFTVRVLRAGP